MPASRANARRSLVDTARCGIHFMCASRLTRLRRPAVHRPVHSLVASTGSRRVIALNARTPNARGVPVPLALRSLVDLAVPPSCAACGAPDDSLCAGCRDDLRLERWPDGPRLVVPSPCPAGLPAVVASAPFAGTAARLVVAHK